MLIVAGPTGANAHDGGVLHPEQQARVFSVMEGVRDLHLEDAINFVGAPEADLEALKKVHTAKYLDELESFCLLGGGDIDPDTYAKADSFIAARRAAGAGLEAIRTLELQGEGVAFVPVRPPGHHAEADRAMGFCLLNNVAVSAAALAAEGHRVLIVDWDVHHGNGTQSIFWDDPRVLYVSTHQWPLFPGTGRAQEVGGPNAVGLTVNIPLPRGATGDIVQCAFEQVAHPVIGRFEPDWVLVSCGFDAHQADPLGELCLSTGDFSQLARLVRSFAPGPGRLALFLEGGYSARALRSSTMAVLGALLDVEVGLEPPTSGGPGREAVMSAQKAQILAMAVLQDGGANSEPN